MKKFIIAAAVLIATGLTAVSLTHKETKQEVVKIKIEQSGFSTKDANAPKKDLGSADWSTNEWFNELVIFALKIIQEWTNEQVNRWTDYICCKS